METVGNWCLAALCIRPVICLGFRMYRPLARFFAPKQSLGLSPDGGRKRPRSCPGSHPGLPERRRFSLCAVVNERYQQEVYWKTYGPWGRSYVGDASQDADTVTRVLPARGDPGIRPPIWRQVSFWPGIPLITTPSRPVLVAQRPARCLRRFSCPVACAPGPKETRGLAVTPPMERGNDDASIRAVQLQRHHHGCR